MRESQPEPEPPSTNSLPVHEEAVEASGLQWHILFDSGTGTGTGTGSCPEELTESFITRCCRATLNQQDLLELTELSDLELSVQLLGPQAMRELNLQYRQKDSPTNVLSFASELPVMIADTEATNESVGGGLLILGDLVLCPDVIAREASEQSKLPLQHWAHMLVHGTLHLCGYDHEDGQKAQAMEAIEILVLSELGIPDPYAMPNVVNKR